MSWRVSYGRGVVREHFDAARHSWTVIVSGGHGIRFRRWGYERGGLDGGGMVVGTKMLGRMVVRGSVARGRMGRKLERLKRE